MRRPLLVNVRVQFLFLYHQNISKTQRIQLSKCKKLFSATHTNQKLYYGVFGLRVDENARAVAISQDCNVTETPLIYFS